MMQDNFRVVDSDGSGEVSRQELKDVFDNDTIKLEVCLKALDLNPSDADTLLTTTSLAM